MEKTLEKPKRKYSAPRCLAFMLKTAWETRRQVPFVVLLLAVLELCQNLVNLYLAPEILKRVEQDAPIAELLLTVAIFTLAVMLLSAIRRYMDGVALYPRIDVRSEIVLRISDKGGATSYQNTLDLGFNKAWELSSTATGSNREATEYIWTTLTELLTNILGFVIYLILLRDLDWRLMLVVTVTTAAGFVSTLRAQTLNDRRVEEQGGYEKRLRYLRGLPEEISTAKDIRIFGLADWITSVHDSVLRLYSDFFTRRMAVTLAGDLINAALSVARNGIAYYFLIRMALAGEISASQFVLYFAAVSGFTAWVTGLMSGFAKLREECLDISHVLEYLNWPEPFRFEGGEAIPDLSGGCELALCNVSYRYPGAEADTIRDLSLTVRPGEKLAIVGLNGAGKTTLVKLLCGFLDPTEGTVTLNGVDIRKFNRREYYDLYSAVFQDFSILDVTVAQNVAQSVTDVDLDRVWRCLDSAGLRRDIEGLPRGLDTPVGRDVYLDGVLFSGGQTQRLMLARALYKDGPILVLDEPTAALDPIAENDLYMKYNDMTSGKTSVFISHRLASTRFCDRIIFLKDGKIAEEGTHEELLRKNGDYAALFEVQSRYYREGRDF